jgi:protoheme IX farnesyltransferase
MQMLKDYIQLTKPGIIIGNLITAVGGFFLGLSTAFNTISFLAMFFGLTLVIAAGCVLNNIQDKAIDEKMKRTRNRVIVKGRVSIQAATYFGWILITLGLVILSLFTNLLTSAAAFLGFIVYVFIYTPMKKNSIHGTLIGSIAGAVPPVVGYLAASGRLDLGAALVFVIIALWQMPHFYAIALYRMEEYKAASVPVLPLINGIASTKTQMFYYTLAFAFASLLPYYFNYTGLMYLVVASGLGFYWVILAAKGFKTRCHVSWARRMFKVSLLVVMGLSLMIAIG